MCLNHKLSGTASLVFKNQSYNSKDMENLILPVYIGDRRAFWLVRRKVWIHIMGPWLQSPYDVLGWSETYFVEVFNSSLWIITSSTHYVDTCTRMVTTLLLLFFLQGWTDFRHPSLQAWEWDVQWLRERNNVEVVWWSYIHQYVCLPVNKSLIVIFAGYSGICWKQV